MLFFKPDEIEKILKRHKTYARILHQNGDSSRATSMGFGIKQFHSIERSDTEHIEVGEKYPVRTGPDAEPACYIFIRGIEREELQEIKYFPEETAYREGMDPDGRTPMLDQFIMGWDAKHPDGKKWADNPTIWRIHFSLTDAPTATDAQTESPAGSESAQAPEPPQLPQSTQKPDEG